MLSETGIKEDCNRKETDQGAQKKIRGRAGEEKKKGQQAARSAATVIHVQKGSKRAHSKGKTPTGSDKGTGGQKAKRRWPHRHKDNDLKHLEDRSQPREMFFWTHRGGP